MTYDGTNWIADAFYDSNNYAYVRQYTTTTDASYPMLFAYETTLPDSYDTKYTRKATGFTYNPSTKVLALPEGASITVNGTTAKLTDTTYGFATSANRGVVQTFKFYNNAATYAGTLPGSPDTSATPNVNATTTTTGRYYGVEADKNGRLFVNVPWSNTTYSNHVRGTTASTSTGMVIPASAARQIHTW